MYIYYQNNKAVFNYSPRMKYGSFLENIFDPMFEMRAEFDVRGTVTINGRFDGITAVDSLCLGDTNAYSYKLITREGTFSGRTQGLITINNFDKTVFTDYFTLELKGDAEEDLYLGYLYIGEKTVLPRFELKSNTGMALTSEASRSFSGQVFGMKRVTLDSFSVKFPRLSFEERDTIKEYIKSVQTVEPHIIDPFYEARTESPAMYVTLAQGDYSFQKRDEDGFYYTGSLEWREAK
jgi:hypothetical protein